MDDLDQQAAQLLAEEQQRRQQVKRRQFIRRLREDLIRYGDPPTLVHQLPMTALLARHERRVRRLMTTTPGEERGCRD